jgi:Rieske Fe-S protein
VRRVTELADAAFPFAGAVALDDQIGIDPVTLADALARELVAAGGALHTGIRVTRVHALPKGRVETAEGPMSADSIVLATGTPIADRGLYFAKTRGMRSYCVSFRTDALIPEGMLLSVDERSRSIRPVASGDGPAGEGRLVVGGGGHPVGRTESEAALVADIVAWTQRFFPDAVETHRWSAQDYQSHNLVPFVGAMPRSLGRIRIATGYNKWGLTNGPAAALRLTAEIQKIPWKKRSRWMVQLGTRMTVPADLGRGIAENALVGAAAVNGWTGAETTPVPVPRPAEGEGVVANRGGKPVGISTVDGTTRAVSVVCTHLGGVLNWNDAECTWDCPLHSSRFAPDGTRIEGPAVRDLGTVTNGG